MDAGKSGYSQVWIPGTDTENRFIERRNEYTVFALSRCFIQVHWYSTVYAGSGIVLVHTYSRAVLRIRL